MGYNIKKLPYKTRSWKLRFKSRVNGNNKDWDIPIDQYLALGFKPSMSVDEAKAWCSQLNASEHQKRVNEKREAAKRRLKEKESQLNLGVPDDWALEFEKFKLSGNKKQASHWLATKSIVSELKLDISDWAYYKEQYYRLFQRRQYSYSYVQKILYLINLWGAFLSRRRKVYFEPIPYPAGIDKQRIIDAYEEKGRTASKPLNSDTLQLHENNFSPENYKWLYMSVWLGLRPSEVDQLKQAAGKFWYIDNSQPISVLWVYQSKLVGVKKEDRYKPIPLKYPEQSLCIPMIESKAFKRPLNKTLQKYFGPGYTCYAGRKGFTDLMLAKGESLEAISQWLGHKSIDRTWKSYKDKKKVLF